MAENDNTLLRKISFFQILPRMMKFRLQMKKNAVSFIVIHSDQPRQDTSSDGSLFSTPASGTIHQLRFKIS